MVKNSFVYKDKLGVKLITTSHTIARTYKLTFCFTSTKNLLFMMWAL
jgi:hypothetical protein